MLMYKLNKSLTDVGSHKSACQSLLSTLGQAKFTHFQHKIRCKDKQFFVTSKLF